jgi:hypothetical protein
MHRLLNFSTFVPCWDAWFFHKRNIMVEMVGTRLRNGVLARSAMGWASAGAYVGIFK